MERVWLQCLATSVLVMLYVHRWYWPKRILCSWRVCKCSYTIWACFFQGYFSLSVGLSEENWHRHHTCTCEFYLRSLPPLQSHVYTHTCMQWYKTLWARCLTAAVCRSSSALQKSSPRNLWVECLHSWLMPLSWNWTQPPWRKWVHLRAWSLQTELCPRLNICARQQAQGVLCFLYSFMISW